MKFSGSVVLALMSINTFAAIDYSLCERNSQDFHGRVSTEGQIIPRKDEKIKSMKTNKDGSIEVLFQSTDPRMRVEEVIVFKKDKDGNIIGVRKSKDFSKLSKNELKEIRKNEAYRLAHGFYPGSCTGYGWGTVGIGSGEGHYGDCSSASIYLNKQRVYVAPEMMTKEEYEKLNLVLSWEKFDEMRKTEAELRKNREKVAEAYEKFLDKNGWAFYSGEEFEFGIQDGKCFTKKQNHLMTDGRMGATHSMQVYDAEKCEKITDVYKQYEKNLRSCEVDRYNFNKDVSTKLYGFQVPRYNVSQDYKGEFAIQGLPFTDWDKELTKCDLFQANASNLPGKQKSESSQQ